MDLGDDVWPRDDQVVVAALERGAAEVGRRQLERLEARAHRAVEDEDPAPKLVQIRSTITHCPPFSEGDGWPAFDWRSIY